MRELKKITINSVRFIIWDEARGGCPDASGIRLLLSARDGVGADELLVLPKSRPLAICAYTKDGLKTCVSDEALHAVSISFSKSASPIPETNILQNDNQIDYVEVRLTNSFCERLFETTGTKSRLAG